ncbi:ceramidase domain-containing protein [Methylolobus aquaticus]
MVQRSAMPLVLITVVAAIAAALLPPIAQDPAYHAFADRRTLLGIPNCADALSNLPFIVVGALGLRSLSSGYPPGGLTELLPAYRAFFAGMVLVGVGSLYYHLDPTNATLVWDRLPMTISFMAFFAAVVGEHLSPALGRRLLWPLVVLGLATVLYWHLTETAGRGDLRPYALVQFLPLALMPLILLRHPSRLQGTRYLWAVLAAYALAKGAEAADAWIFGATGFVSGHSLKHLLAAGGGYAFLLALRQRHPSNCDLAG